MATHTYQMAINYNAGGQFSSNILHFTFDDGGFVTTASAARGLIQGWDNAHRTHLRNILPAHVTILSYRARAVGISGGFEGQAIISSSNTGNRTGAMPCAGVGPVSILYPIGNGRQRGRIFWPGIVEGDSIDGFIMSGLRSALNASLAAMITPFAAVGGGTPTVQPVIYSRRLNQAFNIFAAQTSPMIGQVRRRNLPV